mgnify:FL=1
MLFRSHLALADLCTALEREYGLEPDNHQSHQRGAASRAADMERHAGVDSLVGWIKRECLEEIKAAQSWVELHQVMRDNGLEMTRRGNGLVIHKDYAKDRERLYEGHQRRQWADWLKQEATQGNSEALAALRAREVAQGLKGNTLAAQGKVKPGHVPVIDNITKKGTIIYRAGQSAVRDDGDRLQVSTGADRAGVLEALRLAAERYGDRITVNGTVEFKAQAIRAAVDGKLAITFADPALEKRRQALLQDNFSATRKAGVPVVGKAPPPAARAGRLRSLAQAEALQIEGAAAVVTPQRPAVAPTPASSDLARRKAKLQAELSAKKDGINQRKGCGR